MYEIRELAEMYNFKDFLGKEAKFEAYLQGDIKTILKKIDVSASGEVVLTHSLTHSLT